MSQFETKLDFKRSAAGASALFLSSQRVRSTPIYELLQGKDLARRKKVLANLKLFLQYE